jgi:hypothetical protein
MPLVELSRHLLDKHIASDVADAKGELLVMALYKNALGRLQVDAGGKSHWMGFLQATDTRPAISRAQLVLEFIGSLTATSVNSDSVIFDNKVAQALTSLTTEANQESQNTNPDKLLQAYWDASRNEEPSVNQAQAHIQNANAPEKKSGN